MQRRNGVFQIASERLAGGLKSPKVSQALRQAVNQTLTSSHHLRENMAGVSPLQSENAPLP